jgi:hypothetical protein
MMVIGKDEDQDGDKKPRVGSDVGQDVYPGACWLIICHLQHS